MVGFRVHHPVTFAPPIDFHVNQFRRAIARPWPFKVAQNCLSFFPTAPFKLFFQTRTVTTGGTVIVIHFQKRFSVFLHSRQVVLMPQPA